ncbi:flavin prenyltransferase UbiX [Mycolicibacterium murale]|jgi:4-hydroxy-3-polyprenylbenzoate decarboxylase|uniref:Flavin prenyltransferase UbiX n=1 Tax=Mycolicibacterium murale TaxID=182220 RepID=A0A7I9WQN3_9MYCO|nr:UbiX family flavin prenyltransferase [Mycolicibacterium murale]MCV7183609.1 UbiX family flavin prenyltransferase [Mycolicibacterium murale]GFG59859.1 flavin prenyltransferase UbiX [Mycolicibacterium murale]
MTIRVIVGITGASGTAYGVRLLEVLQQEPDVETHLVMSQSARRTLHFETDITAREIEDRADVVHKPNDIGASIASGSFRAHAMVVTPCSMKTAAGIATSYSDNLLLRAADVMLKERRRLVLLVRETPLHLGHLRTLTQLAEIGAIVMPATPAFYQRPATIDDLIDQTVNRVLDLADVELRRDLFPRWTGAQVPAPELRREPGLVRPVH